MTSQPTAYTKPLPVIDEVTKPFWDAAKEHVLVTQRCLKCDTRVMYTKEVCPRCFSMDFEWAPVTGMGRVYSFIVTRQPANPAFNNDVPFIFAIVQLDEGPRMITNIVGCPIEDVQVDMRVKVHFDDVTPEVTLVKFAPA